MKRTLTLIAVLLLAPLAVQPADDASSRDTPRGDRHPPNFIVLRDGAHDPAHTGCAASAQPTPASALLVCRANPAAPTASSV